MTESMPYFLMLAFQSHGESFLALNQLSDHKQLTLLRSGQMHSGLILQIWSAQQKINLPQNLKPADHVWIENPHSQLVAGYFRQLHNPVKNNLLIMESQNLSALLLKAQSALCDFKFEWVDMERAPLSGKSAVVYLANGKVSQDFIQSATELQMTLIEVPSEKVLSLFNV